MQCEMLSEFSYPVLPLTSCNIYMTSPWRWRRHCDVTLTQALHGTDTPCLEIVIALHTALSPAMTWTVLCI